MTCDMSNSKLICLISGATILNSGRFTFDEPAGIREQAFQPTTLVRLGSVLHSGPALHTSACVSRIATLKRLFDIDCGSTPEFGYEAKDTNSIHVWACSVQLPADPYYAADVKKV